MAWWRPGFDSWPGHSAPSPRVWRTQSGRPGRKGQVDPVGFVSGPGPMIVTGRRVAVQRTPM